MANEMVWIDLEMTGLDIEHESIIEIATIITDGNLNIIAEGPNLAISVNEELLEGMDEWNTTHHTSSGLVDRVRNEGVSLGLSLIHISEPTRLGMISYAVFCLKKKIRRSSSSRSYSAW